MAGSGVSAGHETRLHYYWEDAGFAAAPSDSTLKALGWNAQMTTAEGSNALQRVFMPGKRIAIDQLAMIFEGSFSVQFTLAEPWWVRMLLGTPTQTANDVDGDGVTDTWTYDYTDTAPESFQLREGHEQSGKERVLKGCVVTRATVDVSVEEEVQITLEGAYADEEIQSPASLPDQVTPDYDPLTFAEGSISVGGAVESYVQSMSLTIEGNVDLIREMGSRFPIDFNEKVLAPDVDYTPLHDGDEANLKDFYGSSSATTAQEDADDNAVGLDMLFDNGKAAGSGKNTVEFSLTGTLTDTFGEGGVGDPRADLEESVSRAGRDLNVSATNEESSAP